MFLSNKILLLGFFGMSLLPVSCRQQISFPNFDSQAWIADAFACQKVRPGLVPELDKIRRDLRGLRTTEILSILGKPDAEALLANNQRIYYYYVQAGAQCQNRQQLSAANKLQVRFNALETVSEINFEQPIF